MFFFLKQKAAYEMRISDWSSDVCSSDLTTITGTGRNSGALLRIPLEEHLQRQQKRRPPGPHFAAIFARFLRVPSTLTAFRAVSMLRAIFGHGSRLPTASTGSEAAGQ